MFNLDKRHICHYHNGHTFGEDSPIMALIIFDKVDPVTYLDTHALKNKLNLFNFKKHDDDGTLMLDDMKLTCDEILKQGGSHDKCLLSKLNAS